MLRKAIKKLMKGSPQTSKDRATIRKAIKNGIVVKHSEDITLFEKFRSIYNATMDKDNADSYYYFDAKFYESMAQNLQGAWQMFYAVLDDEIIAMSIILMCNGRMHYHLSGSVLKYRNLNATNLILYEAAIYGAKHDYKILHLGGGVGSGEDPLYKFKKTFKIPETIRKKRGLFVSPMDLKSAAPKL